MLSILQTTSVLQYSSIKWDKVEGKLFKGFARLHPEDGFIQDKFYIKKYNHNSESKHFPSQL